MTQPFRTKTSSRWEGSRKAKAPGPERESRVRDLGLTGSSPTPNLGTGSLPSVAKEFADDLPSVKTEPLSRRPLRCTDVARFEAMERVIAEAREFYLAHEFWLTVPEGVHDDPEVLANASGAMDGAHQRLGIALAELEK